MWVCKVCGNTEKFHGYQEYKEWGTEGILVNSEGEILDYFGRESEDSESGSRTIEKCGKCNSEEITNMPEEEFDLWEKENYDGSGNFVKKDKNPTDKFISVNKLQLLNDRLLKNEVSIEEYRQQVQQIKNS